MAICRSGNNGFPILARLLEAKSGRTLPHSKTWPSFGTRNSLALWSAAVFRRFGIACHSITGRKSSLTFNPSVLNR